MKQAFLFLLLFIPAKTVLRCSCEEPATTDRYMTSDFIGIIEIRQTEDVKSDRERYYSADLEPITKYCLILIL